MKKVLGKYERGYSINKASMDELSCQSLTHCWQRWKRLSPSWFQMKTRRGNGWNRLWKKSSIQRWVLSQVSGIGKLSSLQRTLSPGKNCWRLLYCFRMVWKLAWTLGGKICTPSTRTRRPCRGLSEQNGTTTLLVVSGQLIESLDMMRMDMVRMDFL